MKNLMQLGRDFPPFPNVCLPMVSKIAKARKREREEKKKHTNT